MTLHAKLARIQSYALYLQSIDPPEFSSAIDAVDSGNAILLALDALDRVSSFANGAESIAQNASSINEYVARGKSALARENKARSDFLKRKADEIQEHTTVQQFVEDLILAAQSDPSIIPLAQEAVQHRVSIGSMYSALLQRINQVQSRLDDRKDARANFLTLAKHSKALLRQQVQVLRAKIQTIDAFDPSLLADPV